MSNILSKDRKPLSNRLYIELEATNLLVKIINIINNPELFPPEYKDTLGSVLFNNCNCCVESINMANRTILSINTYKNRKNFSFKSYNACTALLSNLNTYYNIMNVPDIKKKFILELINSTNNLLSSIDKWIKSDEKRFRTMENEQSIIIEREKARKNAERIERAVLSKRRETPGVVIPFYFVGANNNALGDAANTNKQIIENAIKLKTTWKW